MNDKSLFKYRTITPRRVVIVEKPKVPAKAGKSTFKRLPKLSLDN